MIVLCENCKIHFEKKDYLIEKSKMHFCSKKCQHEWRTGKTDLIKKKGKYKTCPICQTVFYCFPSEIGNKKTCSKECSYKLGRLLGKHSGENCNFWAGGYDEYRGASWYKQRSEARKRDNDICQICGKTKEEEGRHMIVHHIVPFRFFENDYVKANDLINLMCVCASCHGKMESHLWRKVPKEYQYLLNGIIPQEKSIRDNRYKDHEIEFMKNNYMKLGATELAKILNRPYSSIADKARELNLKYEYWSDEDTELLKLNYPIKNKKEILDLFPDKSYLAIKSYANGMGILKVKLWTEEEKEFIKSNYPIYDINYICYNLRNKTKSQIKAYIDNHKIKKIS